MAIRLEQRIAKALSLAKDMTTEEWYGVSYRDNKISLVTLIEDQKITKHTPMTEADIELICSIPELISIIRDQQDLIKRLKQGK